MQPLSFLSSLYRLENLDTRLVSSRSVPYSSDRASDAGARSGKSRDGVVAQPSRWNTVEFWLYYLVISIAVPYMFWMAFDVSRPSDPRYPKFENQLAPGWIPGRLIDASDPQYHTFRANLPYVAALLVIHPLGRRLWNTFVRPLPRDAFKAAALERADLRLEQRASYDFSFAMLFLVGLHGFSAIKVLLIFWANYLLATAIPARTVPVATWTFNISVLFANELCQGYRFKAVAGLVAGSGDGSGVLVTFGGWLDSWGGLMPRWEILFNITVLRLISFNLDYYWSLGRSSLSPVEKKQLDPANLSERDRVSTPARACDYSFRNYVAYAVYAPLYLAGPIITFNDYISQQRHQMASIEPSRTILYGVRFLVALLTMEVVLHFNYVGAIGKASPVWASYTAAQLSVLSYFNLHLIWLKLMLAWRLFRLWALVDGIDPPENILRCVSNNYSPVSFWRAWHRSYNRWLIRYVYIPLGGADFKSRGAALRSLFNYIVIFTFVALWHDIQLRLLVWGWLIVLFFVPEVLGGYLFPLKNWQHRPNAYRMLCCAGAVGNVLAMMSANLVGFAVGIDGLQSIISGILHDFSGVAFLAIACLVLFTGVQVMFEIRESELRKGIQLRC